MGVGDDDPPKLSNRYTREAFLALARATTIQVNLCMVPRVNVLERILTSRLRDFVRMNPPIFICSKMGEDPQ